MNNLNAIIGIIGTLLGTILGWLLNQLSSKGKLKIFPAKWEDELYYFYSGVKRTAETVEQIKNYSYRCFLDVYNASSEPRVLRDVRIVFRNKKEELLSSVPQDEDTLHGESRLAYFDNIGPLTIGAKSAVRIKIRDSEQNGEGRDSFIWKTKRIYLTYRNEKNRLKRVLIHEEDYSKRFDNYTEEEQGNG